MIKIAFIIDSIETPNAGTEKQLLALINGLDKKRFRPCLICLKNSEWQNQQTFSFSYKHFNFSRIISFGFVKNLKQLTRFLSEESFDIVQTFFFDANIAGTIAARLSGGRILVTSRRNIGYWQTPARLKVLRFLRRWTDYCLANSRAAAEKAIESEGHKPERCHIIYNGIDLQAFRDFSESQRIEQRRVWNIKPEDILIGMTANYRPVKKIESLIYAAERLAKKYNHLRYVVVGEGPERSRYQALIDNNNLRQKFKLVGHQKDIISCLAAFDLAVLSSSSESFSNSLIEYMAAGLPIVASNVGGNPEAITNNKTGLLYTPTDPDGLINGLEKLLNDRELASALGENARKDAMSRFSMESFLNNHEEFYDTILGRINKAEP
jgi:glycosyltransferase involved in cell wall biosynthesis